MNDRSGEKSGREDKERVGEGSGEFSRAIAKIAVAQICESSGFQSCQQSAIETLTDIAIRYLCDLGKTAHFYANTAGRTDCNVFDIVQGLEDLCSSQGFSGASDVNRCLVDSGVVKEIIDFVESVEETPFAQPVPRFPVIRNRKPTPSFLQIGETPPGDGKHILPWLPAFPDPHTYVRTSMWNERTSDLRADKIEQQRQRRKGERSLLRLQQGLASNGSAPSTSAAVEPLVLDDRNNPFLAPPLQSGEIDVYPATVPSKLLSIEARPDTQGVSILETFAPVIEAAKDGQQYDSGREECERKDPSLPHKRLVVNFKFGVGKKSVVKPLMDSTLHRKGAGRLGYWFGKDDEKDDKKRRAEQILKESIENPQELAQL
ncbi:hypothetical protein GIB67_000618 [Kingdonia uniflora]|uniref:Transcription initiation factor TFIID subunit 8 n=1 Tax=Kingdonia uniflora TaxID=39325 RepID=A0A7J7NDA0_9MAGN|nr:hypothetical protein GIB67_000618 [Kingdonia uniflora]